MTTVIVGEFLGAPLALTDDELAAARARVAGLLPTPGQSHGVPLLVDAVELARLTCTAASWWEAAARNTDCPSTMIGNVRRFSVAACLKWLESVQERDANGRVLRCSAAPRARGNS